MMFPVIEPIRDKNGYLKVHGFTSLVTVKAKLPSPFNTIQPTRPGSVIIERSWYDHQANVTPAIEQPSISQTRINNCPNILFIPDGFKDGEETLFIQLVTKMIEQIRKSPSLLPYGLFIKRKTINFWRVFIISPQDGSSVLNFMKIDRRNNLDAVASIDPDSPPYAVKPDISSPHIWTLQELIYVVGLPLEFDQKQPDDLGTYRNKLAIWRSRFNHGDIIRSLVTGELPTQTWQRKVDIDLWRKWKSVGGYVLADERDTALGMAKGNRPFLVDTIPQVRLLTQHPFRTKRRHLDKFLVNLKAPGIVTPIGKIWVVYLILLILTIRLKERIVKMLLCFVVADHAGSGVRDPK